MALLTTSSTGSGVTSSGRNDLPRFPHKSTVGHLPELDGKSMTNEAVMQRSHINNTAYNIDSYRNQTAMVDGYPEGRVIEVTYYSNAVRPADAISHFTNMVVDSHIDEVHSSWIEIRNFELRCREELKYDYDIDSNISRIDSTGLTLPGFDPMIGDFFLYAINGKVGVFTITDIRRLAFHTNTYHEVSFKLSKFLDADFRDTIMKQRVDIRYFDKAKFLSGNTSMLTTDAYQYQNDLFRIRKEIVSDYIARFYNSYMDTFIRPDGVYDPYAVEFFRIKVSSIDYPSGYPIQMLIGMSNYKKTIWGLLTNNPIKNLRNVDRHGWIGTMHNTIWSANMTSLIGKEYLMVGGEATEYSTNPLYSFVYRTTDLQKRKEHQDYLVSGACHRKCNLHLHHPYEPIPNSCHPDHVRSFCEATNDLLDKAEILRQQELEEEQRYKGPQILPPFRRAPESLEDINPDLEHVQVTNDLNDQWTPRWDENELLVIVDGGDTEPANDDGTDEMKISRRFPSDWPEDLTSDGLILVVGDEPSDFTPPEYPPEEEEELPEPPPEETRPCMSCQHPHHYPHDHHWSYGLREQHHHHYPNCMHNCGNPHGIDTDGCGGDRCCCNSPSYVLSNYFYDGVIDKMSQVELLVYNTAIKNDIHVGSIHNYVYEYLNKDDRDAFYSHLFGIYLIDKALYWLRFHS